MDGWTGIEASGRQTDRSMEGTDGWKNKWTDDRPADGRVDDTPEDRWTERQTGGRTKRKDKYRDICRHTDKQTC